MTTETAPRFANWNLTDYFDEFDGPDYRSAREAIETKIGG